MSIFVLPAIAWVPLFALTAAAGTLLPGRVASPFLYDIAAHVRLLVALPLFLSAGIVAATRLRPTMQQFVIRRIVPDDAMARFDAAVASAFRLGDSAVADILIIVFIYGIDGIVVRRTNDALSTAWFLGSTGNGTPLTAAGLWFALVSLPIFEFVLLRWYYRLAIWARFLFQVSKLRLRLIPSNPDRLGGLGFLLTGTQAFTIFAMAHGALLAGWLSNRVFVRGTSLAGYKGEIIAVVALVLCITIGPLLVFTRALMRAKRRGILEYGALATRYVREFDDKWVHPGQEPSEPLVGSGDVQSLADMGGSYDLIRSMRSVPLTLEMTLGFVGITLLPVAPLLLTMMPLSEILNKLVKIVL